MLALADEVIELGPLLVGLSRLIFAEALELKKPTPPQPVP